MSEHANNADEIRIKALLESWADAVRRTTFPPSSLIMSRIW
jgi:hypothetical protein